MKNVNRKPHEVVATDKVFLFTKRHLKTEFPNYFVDEDSTYFFAKNGFLEVFQVSGDQCIPYENFDDQALYRLTMRYNWRHRPSIAVKMKITNHNHLISRRSKMNIEWTESRNTSDESRYKFRIVVEGRYFEKFTTWLKQHVPQVMIKTENIDY